MPETNTDYREGLIHITGDISRVQKSIDELYGTISNLAHFNPGETYPIRVSQFDRSSDTLALISFLQHYDIPVTVAPKDPIPSTPQSSSSSVLNEPAGCS